jgi:cysteine desulfurase family protein (TIGR01976 family)
MMLDVHTLRRQFPALQHKRAGRIPIFLDGPGGTQVPQRVVDAMTHYLTRCNANHGGVFATSEESDAILHRAHQRMADLLNAPSPDEVVFGSNMTTMTLHLSRAIGRTWKAGDEVVVTHLDHDANVTPWALAARDAGAVVRWVNIHPEDCTLDLDSLRRQLGPKTRLVAVGVASNATGTVNDIGTVARLAREVGARLFVDAVHFAPHGPIDVQAWNCDFLACSAYKFFGPHVGVLWGRRELLAELPAYKLRPVPETLPDRWMTGTQNHEGLAGVAAAVDYLADVGQHLPTGPPSSLRASLTAIRAYETELSLRLLAGLTQRPRFKILGISDPARIHERVPTVSITCSTHSAEQMARHLAARQIFAWHGNMYALNLSERLNLEERGGFLRLGLVHYNTLEEIDEVLRALDEL